MLEKILEVINQIRANKSLVAISEIKVTSNLRNDIGFDSFDLAELTVRLEDIYDIDIFEDGLVNTVGEILKKLEVND